MKPSKIIDTFETYHYAVGDVLGQRVDKKLNVIHYASKTLDSAQRNMLLRGRNF